MSKLFQPLVITWNEPNREEAPPLHIASKGTRLPTVTGVAWLSEHQFAAVHRCGFRLAVFDTRNQTKPTCFAATPHRADDVAARYLGDDRWELVVSGCFEAHHTRYRLELGQESRLRPDYTHWARDGSFSHGVKYDLDGNICVCLHTGPDPRIEIGDKVWRIPRPWGVRNLCQDPTDGTYYAVAVSKNPQLKAYDAPETSVWTLPAGADAWNMLFRLRDTHSDNIVIHKNRLWLPDQRSDRLLGVPTNGDGGIIEVRDRFIDFPHGIAVSAGGRLAVTSYGTSSVIVFDLEQAAGSAGTPPLKRPDTSLQL